MNGETRDGQGCMLAALPGGQRVGLFSLASRRSSFGQRFTCRHIFSYLIFAHLHLPPRAPCPRASLRFIITTGLKAIAKNMLTRVFAADFLAFTREDKGCVN